MADIATRWRMNSNVVHRPLRTIWLICTVAFILFSTENVGHTTGYLRLILSLSTYLLVSICIIGIYLRDKQLTHSILANDSSIFIPRAIFKPRQVKLDQIKSVETYGAPEKALAVLIGRRNKHSILLERHAFSSDYEFDSFIQFLRNSIIRFARPEASQYSNSVKFCSTVKSQSPLISLVLALLIIYVVLIGSGTDITDPAAISQGGLSKQGIRKTELYRIGSSFFLHLTPFHLGLNLLGLAALGRHISVLLGNTRLIIILFFSAISGALLSLAYSPYDIVVGASGGILGLLGAYLLICFKFERQLPGSVSVSPKILLSVLALQIACDAIVGGTDIFSHAGGFLFGISYAQWALNERTLLQANEHSSIEFLLAVAVTLFFTVSLLSFFVLHFGVGVAPA